MTGALVTLAVLGLAAGLWRIVAGPLCRCGHRSRKHIQRYGGCRVRYCRCGHVVTRGGARR